MKTETSQPKHTKKEWKLIGDGASGSLIGIPDDAGTYNYIAEMTGFDKSHGRRIVKCVNNEWKVDMHEELKKALKELIEAYEKPRLLEYSELQKRANVAKQILKKAEGK